VRLNLNEPCFSGQSFLMDQDISQTRDSRSPVICIGRESISGKNLYTKPPTAGQLSRNSGAGLPKVADTAEVITPKIFNEDSKSPMNITSNARHARKISSGKVPFSIR
jgi:hypothetical protein